MLEPSLRLGDPPALLPDARGTSSDAQIPVSGHPPSGIKSVTTGMGGCDEVSTVSIRVLGPLRIEGHPTPPRRERVVLSALALRAGTAVPADLLADALWGDHVPSSWRKIVQGAVVRLRRQLGRAVIETTPSGYRLLTGQEDLDAAEFESLVDRGGRLADAGEHRRAVDLLGRALALWRGDPLSDLEEWEPAAAGIARLHELRRLAAERLLRSRLALGEHEVVTAEAAALVAAEPLREQIWGLLALAQYRSGRQSDALRSLSRARKVLAEELGVNLSSELVALEQAILLHDPGLIFSALPQPRPSDACPYRGLAPYDVEDRGMFFGRADEVASCRRKLAASGVLVVVGESGSGKSSLARAGLTPALRAEGLSVVICSPGPNPDIALVTALSRADQASALIVDQAEELFLACDDPGVRGQFTKAVVDYAASKQVIIVLRADHLGSLTAFPGLAPLVERGLHLLRPMNARELASVVEGPARQAGLQLEDGLVDLVLRDVLEQPAALPMLSHALMETWARREGETLTLAGYRDSGGVHGAVARTAEGWYRALQEEERPVARSLILRLVDAPEDGLVVRHRLPTPSADQDPAQARIVEMLVQARLVTAREDSVEIAHECLTRVWPRLRTWLEEDRQGQRTLRHLVGAAHGWTVLGRDPAELYRGTRLQTALEWTAGHAETLTSEERAFLEASRERAEAEDAVARAQVDLQARTNRWLRRLLATVAICLIVSLVAGLVAVDQRGEARAIAREQALRNLVVQSKLLRETQPDLAALLAVAAYELSPRADAEDALFGMFTRDPGFLGLLRADASGFADAAMLTDGSTLVLTEGSSGGLRLFDLQRMAEVGRIPPAAEGRSGGRLDVTPDGAAAVVASSSPSTPGTGGFAVYDVRSGQPRFAEVPLPFEPVAVAVSDDGRLAAVGGLEAVQVLDVGTGAKVASVARLGPVAAGTSSASVTSVGSGCRALTLVAGTAECRPERRSTAVAFLADDRLVVVHDDGGLRVIDARDGAVQASLEVPAHMADAVEVIDGGRSVLVAGAGGAARWDLVAAKPAWVTKELCTSMTVSEPHHAVLCGRAGGGAQARDLATGAAVGRRFGSEIAGPTSLAAGRDGRFAVAASSSAGVVAVWRLDGSGPVTKVIDSAQAAVIEYDPAGTDLLVRGGGALDGWLPPLAAVDTVSGAAVDLERFALATWSGRPGTLAVLFPDATGGLHRLDGEGRVDGLHVSFDRPPQHAVPDPPRDRMIVATGGSIRGYSMRTGQGVAPRFDLPEEPLGGYGVTPDGRHLLVAMPARGVATYDIESGALVAGPLEQEKTVAVSRQGLAATATAAGVVSFRDPVTLEPMGPALSGTLGPVVELRFSTDRDRLLVFSGDAVHLADVSGRTVIGDPIPVSFNGDLRADGRELAASRRGGIAVWNLDPSAWLEAACGVAGRSISRSEWDRYLGDLADYRPLCGAGRDRPAG